MDVLETHIDTASSEFKQNHELMEGLVGKLRDRVSTARKGGSEKSHQRHQEQGKLFVFLSDGRSHWIVDCTAAHLRTWQGFRERALLRCGVVFSHESQTEGNHTTARWHAAVELAEKQGGLK